MQSVQLNGKKVSNVASGRKAASLSQAVKEQGLDVWFQDPDGSAPYRVLMGRSKSDALSWIDAWLNGDEADSARYVGTQIILKVHTP